MNNIGVLDPEGKNNNPLTGKPYGDKYKELSKFWRKLPVYGKVHDIISDVQNNNVVLVLSSTGSGKSVLVPRIVHHAINYTGKIGMTLPKQIITKSSAQFGSETMDVVLGEEVGYQYKGAPDNSRSNKTKILYMTDGTLTAILNRDPTLSEFDCILIDEAHEMSVNIVLLIYLLRETLKLRPEFKLIIMSATVNVELFSTYFRDFKFKTIDVGGGRIFPIESHFLDKTISYKEVLDEGFNQLIKILEEDDPKTTHAHDIIFFVTSSNEAFTICKQLHDHLAKEKNNKCKITCNGDVFCVELYANMNPEKQTLAQDKELYKKNTKYNRKVAIATNVAESSLTIDGVKYVIETGYELSSSFDPINRARKLDREIISQAQAKQRMGRAGRTEPGICYHMYTKNDFENSMKKYPESEIRTSDITYECLRLLCNKHVLTVEKLTNTLVNLIDPPKESYITCAVNNLIQLGAVENGNITKLGNLINNIPDNNMFMAYAIIYGKLYNCSNEIMKISAIIEACKGNINELYNVPSQNDDNRDNKLIKKFEEAKKKFANAHGDHISLLNIYEKFEEQYAKNHNNIDKLNSWAYDKFLKVNSLLKAVKNYKNNKKQMYNIERIDANELGLKYIEDVLKMDVKERVLICLLLGFRLNTAAKKVGTDNYNTQFVTNKNIKISRSSFLTNNTKQPVNVFYHELFMSMGKIELVIVSHISKKIIKLLS